MLLKNPSRILILLSSLLISGAYFLPLWRILMWAPQYPEWLELKIWINNISGDINTINGLNHYIGMKLIKPEMFPEFQYMTYILAFLIGVGLLTALFKKRWILIGYIGLLIASGIAALIDFYQWGYDYGHNLNPDAAIKIPGMAYQPPLIGTKILLNFTAFSGPDVGGWLIISAAGIAILVLGAEIWLGKKRNT